MTQHLPKKETFDLSFTFETVALPTSNAQVPVHANDYETLVTDVEDWICRLVELQIPTDVELSHDILWVPLGGVGNELVKAYVTLSNQNEPAETYKIKGYFIGMPTDRESFVDCLNDDGRFERD